MDVVAQYELEKAARLVELCKSEFLIKGKRKEVKEFFIKLLGKDDKKPVKTNTSPLKTTHHTN